MSRLKHGLAALEKDLYLENKADSVIKIAASIALSMIIVFLMTMPMTVDNIYLLVFLVDVLTLIQFLYLLFEYICFASEVNEKAKRGDYG